MDNEDCTDIITNSMDNPALYGEVIASVSAKEALELKRICPYTVMTMKLQEIEDDENIKKLESTIPQFLEKDLANCKQTKTQDDDTSTSNVDNFISQNIKRYIRIAYGLIKVIQSRNIKHLITFHRYIAPDGHCTNADSNKITPYNNEKSANRNIFNSSSSNRQFNTNNSYESYDYDHFDRHVQPRYTGYPSTHYHPNHRQGNIPIRRPGGH
jgi:hypothetical protein